MLALLILSPSLTMWMTGPACHTRASLNEVSTKSFELSKSAHERKNQMIDAFRPQQPKHLTLATVKQPAVDHIPHPFASVIGLERNGLLMWKVKHVQDK